MRRLILVLSVLLVMVVPLTAVAGQGAKDTIVIRGLGNLTTFNPVSSQDGASLQAHFLLWPPPFETDANGNTVPGLTSWKVSDDGLTYTFTIQKNANWSDGKPITANDMKFTIG